MNEAISPLPPGRLAAAVVDAAGALGTGLVVVERTDRDRIVFASPEIARLTGYAAQELAGSDPARIFGETPLPWTQPASDPESSSPTEATILRQDGDAMPVEIAISSAGSDERRRWVAFVADLSDRRAKEHQLYRADTRFRTLVDAAPIAVWVLDRDLVRYGNASALLLFGLGSVGSKLPEALDPRSLLHPDEVPLFEKRTFAMLALGQSVPPCEYRVRRFDGEPMVIEVSSVAGTFDGRPAVFSFGRDVTERRRMEAQMLQADRLGALGLLAGGMAHAINNPLTYVLLNLNHVAGQLERIPEDSTVLSEALVRLTEARDGAERVASVVRQMRALSRADEREKGPITVADVIKNAAGMVGNEIRHRGTLHMQLGEVPTVYGNAGRLEQVFLNLFVLAARSLPEHGVRGVVDLRLSQDRENVVTELTSATSADAPADATLSRLGERSGLSLCEGILRAMGGSLQIETAPQSIVYRVTLPADSQRVVMPAPRPRTDSEPPAALGFRARIMVIDDDPGVVAALRVMLEDEHDVTCMASGRDALQTLLRGGDYDVIFCDLMMPDVTGMDLYEALRLNRPGRERRLVFMTGGAFTPDASRFLRTVPNPRLDKPFDIRRLSKLLRKLVS